jgi:hypothetical protein
MPPKKGGRKRTRGGMGPLAAGAINFARENKIASKLARKIVPGPAGDILGSVVGALGFGAQPRMKTSWFGSGGAVAYSS